MLGRVTRFAMNPNILSKFGNFLNPGKMSAIDKAMRFGPDIAFGGLAAMQTPGDLGDKAIAFGATAGGGLLGGLGSAGAVRHFGKNMNPEALQAAMGAADMVGSIGGDFLAMPLGDAISRGKDSLMGGQGLTAWERMGAEQQAQYAEQLKQQLLDQYGIIPGTREQYAVDPTTGYGVA